MATRRKVTFFKPDEKAIRTDERNKTISEVFAEIEKAGFQDKEYEEPTLVIGYHAYRNLKKRFGVKK